MKQVKRSRKQIKERCFNLPTLVAKMKLFISSFDDLQVSLSLVIDSYYTLDYFFIIEIITEALVNCLPQVAQPQHH